MTRLKYERRISDSTRRARFLSLPLLVYRLVLGSTGFPTERVMWAFSWGLAVVLADPSHPAWRLIRQASCMLRRIEARSRNHCCRGKAHTLCVRLYSCLSYPERKSHFSRVILFVIGVLSGCTLFFHSTSQRHNFRGKVFEQRVGVSIYCIISVWNIASSKKKSTRYHECKSSCQVPVIFVRY